jgi:hypothetical protein
MSGPRTRTLFRRLMSALVIGALGLLAFGAAAVLLRSIQGYRIARSLQAAPPVSVEEALALARAGEDRYVRVQGRVTSDEEFPDEHDRPLVYRRRRLSVEQPPGAWRTVSDERQAVPFGIEERAAFIAIDLGALGEGLVVMPRESTGRAEEIPGRLPEGVAPSSPVRLLVEQLSAVEIATVAGVPRRGVDHQAVMTGGAGRPLIVSGLEPAAAMRVLSAGRRRRLQAAAVLMVAGGSLVAVGFAGWAAGLLRAT